MKSQHKKINRNCIEECEGHQRNGKIEIFLHGSFSFMTNVNGGSMIIIKPGIRKFKKARRVLQSAWFHIRRRAVKLPFLYPLYVSQALPRKALQSLWKSSCFILFLYYALYYASFPGRSRKAPKSTRHAPRR